jgi:hypothetical protein
VGKARLIGAHTIVILNKDGWVWPSEEKLEHWPRPHQRWSADKSFETAAVPLKLGFKEYEFKLLAAFAPGSTGSRSRLSSCRLFQPRWVN